MQPTSKRPSLELSGNPLKDVFRSEATALLGRFEMQTALIKHRGERGVAREEALAEVLSRHLPQRFGIGRGQILRHSGSISSQQDIVIFDRDLTPIIDSTSVAQTYPIESTLAVVEVKSAIRPRDVFDFVDRVAEIGAGPGAPIRYPSKEHPRTTEDRWGLHGVMFSYRKGSSIGALTEALYEANLRHPYPPAVGTLAVLDQGTIHFQLPSSLARSSPDIAPERPWGDYLEPVWFKGTDTILDSLGLFFAGVYDLAMQVSAKQRGSHEVTPDIFQYLNVRMDTGVFKVDELGASRAKGHHPSWGAAVQPPTTAPAPSTPSPP